MRTTRLTVLFLVALCGLSSAATTPPINPIAIWQVRHKNTGSIPIGRAVVPHGTFAADGVPYVVRPAGADAQVFCVTYRVAPDDATTGLCLQLGLSNAQVRIGGTSVSLGDKLIVQDNTGVWMPAGAMSVNLYVVALQDCAAASLCWAAPIASRPMQ